MINKFFTLLGYTNNPIIKQYQEKYFQKIFLLVKKMLGEHALFQKNERELKDFLLHPDISSLIQEYSLTETEASLQKLIQEINFLFSDISQLIQNQGCFILGTSIKLTNIDNNPLNVIVNHPDHDTEGMMGWGEKTESEWLEVFKKSFDLLRQVNEEYFNELNTIIKKIVPMKTSFDMHNSCSYKEYIGTLYLGYTINTELPELNILEALIHESSHNKLNLIMQSEELLLNNYELKYYSPYRPDARHIHGI